MANDNLSLRISEIDPPIAYAGERDQWTIRIGGLRLPSGGRVKLQLCGGRGNSGDWQWPQVYDPQGEAFVSAHTSSGAEVSLDVTTWERDREIAVIVTLIRELSEEDVLSIVLGDKSHGGSGIRPQTFTQRAKLFRLFLDRGDGNWIEVKNPPVIEVRGGPADRFELLLPSTIRPRDRFHGLLRIEDQYGNIASFYKGHLELAGEKGRLVVPSPIILSEQDQCLRKLVGMHLREPSAAFRIRVREAQQGKRARSNPVCVMDDDYPYRLYWGVMHGHTNLSDGISTPEEYFLHMRDVSGLDFGALADHDHLWEMTDEKWTKAQMVTAQFNTPGEFVTLLGYEWAKWRRNGDGDRCVYYLDDYQPIYRSDDAHYPRPWTLFKALHDNHRGRALVIPHHTAAKANWCDFSYHDPLHERLIEIYSVWGSSECSVHDGNPLPLRPPDLPDGGEAYHLSLDSGEEPLGFVQRALALGWRVGFTAGGDDHHGHPGDPVRTGPEPFHYRDGLLGVWATELTREAIWEGLWQRRTVATAGPRTVVAWAISGEFMGTDVPVAPGDALMVQRVVLIEAYGEEPIVALEVIRNNEVVHRVRLRDEQVVVEWTDEDPLDLIALRPHPSRPPFVFYYVRLMQADGEMAWASPIWMTLTE